MSRKAEIQVGVTVIVALVLLVWGVTYLKEFSVHSKSKIWHVRFPQTGGLASSDEVQVNGIRKGEVARIQLNGDHVVVDLALASDVVVTRDCVIAIRNVGLMGEKVIAVDLRNTGPRYAPNDTIMGVFEQGMGEVMAGLGGSTASVDRIVQSLDRLAARVESNGDLEKTIHNLRVASEDLSGALKENRLLLKETVANLNVVSKTAKSLATEREGQIKRTLDSVERSTRNLEALSARVDSLRGTLQSVASKVDKGQGSLGALVNDKSLYQDVNASVKALRELVEDLKKHPKKYINLSIF